jgi:hypothetical protein
MKAHHLDRLAGKVDDGLPVQRRRQQQETGD